jgi:hypothetical protein
VTPVAFVYSRAPRRKHRCSTHEELQEKDFPVENVRRFLEPGPVVLVTSAHRAERTIMTMGWHMMMFEQPLPLGCFIWDQNYSRRLAAIPNHAPPPRRRRLHAIRPQRQLPPAVQERELVGKNRRPNRFAPLRLRVSLLPASPGSRTPVWEPSARNSVSLSRSGPKTKIPAPQPLAASRLRTSFCRPSHFVY